MKYTFAELVDLEKAQTLMDSYCLALGIASAIIDFEGNVLVASNWQPLCMQFHRVNEETCKMCIESDTVLGNRLQEGQRYTFYECKNGLLDAATPIIIDGEHVINLFIGQFLVEEPDVDYFRRQGERYGFDMEAYMAALAQVPVISRERVEKALNFMSEFATLIGEMGLQQKRQLEYAEQLEAEITQRKRLEEQIRESLERREGQVQISTEVAQEIAAAPAVEDLFEQVVNLVKERFGYYHAHIYTIEGESLVMQAGSGEAGQQMKEAGHQIGLAAERSLVARAARNGQAVLVPDVSQEEGWLPNPLLPETRAEIAVPIKLGDQVLGVLDVQADTVGGLSEEDELLLFGLCGQIATAMESTRRLEQASIFLQLAEASGQGIGLGTLQGEIIYMNPTLCRLLEEVDPENAYGNSFMQYYPPEMQAVLQNEVLPAVMEQGQWVGESTLRSSTGKLTPVIENFSLIRDEAGNPLYLADVLTDISRQKQAEAELESRLQELTALQRLMSREEWQTFQSVQAETVQGFVFDRAAVRPMTAADLTDGYGLVGLAESAVSGNGHHLITRPVAVHEEVIGRIGVYDDPDHPLEVEDQEFLDSIAAQVAEALERSRLLEQTQKRAVELGAVAQVSTVAATTLEVERLLQTVVDLTKQRFGLYHAHIYLLDEAENTLVLAAGAGEVGRQMVAEDWRIPVDKEDSLVARAARFGQGVIANDVRQRADFLPHPLLPETRSEMAVPMMLGEKVVGVLDVQADVVNRFTEEDIRIKTTLTGQIAVSLQNARLFAEQQRTSSMLEERMKELNLLNEVGRQIAETPPVPELLAWVAANIPPAMQYPDLCQAAVEFEERVYGVLEAVELPCQITHALRVGEEVVGRIYIAYTEKRDFLDEESALLGGIARRISGYIENRRLFEQIQARAQREQLLREITARVRGSIDPDTIVRTAVRQLGDTLGRPTFVRLGSADQLRGVRETRPGAGNGKQGQKNGQEG